MLRRLLIVLAMAAAPSLLASGDKYDDLLAPNEEMAAIESSVMDVDAFDLPYGDDAADYASDNVVSSEDELSSIHTAVQVSVPVIGIADAISVDEASVTYNEEEGVASIIIADDYVGSKDLQEQLVTSSTIAATSANDIWAEALCRATEIPIFASTYLAFNVSDEYDLLLDHDEAQLVLLNSFQRFTTSAVLCVFVSDSMLYLYFGDQASMMRAESDLAFIVKIVILPEAIKLVIDGNNLPPLLKPVQSPRRTNCTSTSCTLMNCKLPLLFFAAGLVSLGLTLRLQFAPSNQESAPPLPLKGVELV